MGRVMTCKQLTRSVRKLHNEQELKYFDSTSQDVIIQGANAFAAVPPMLVYLNAGIVTGTGTSQRVGREIYITSLKMNLVIKGYATGAIVPDPWNMVRVMIVRSEVALTTLSQLFIQPNNGGVAYDASETNMLVHYDYYKKHDFKVLFDDIIDVSSLATDGVTSSVWNPGKYMKMYRIKIPLNLKVPYVAGLNNPENNWLTLLCYSTSTAASHPTATYSARIYYTDS